MGNSLGCTKLTYQYTMYYVHVNVCVKNIYMLPEYGSDQNKHWKMDLGHTWIEFKS